jgi:hypothetical protein
LRNAMFGALGFYALAALLMGGAGFALRKDLLEDAGAFTPTDGRAWGSTPAGRHRC